MAKRPDQGASSSDRKTLDIKKEYVAELDFCSDKFDPLLALKTENISIPAPDILSFESLTKYEDAVSRSQRKQESKSSQRIKEENDPGIHKSKDRAHSSKEYHKDKPSRHPSHASSSSSSTSRSHSSSRPATSEAYQLLKEIKEEFQHSRSHSVGSSSQRSRLSRSDKDSLGLDKRQKDHQSETKRSSDNESRSRKEQHARSNRDFHGHSKQHHDHKHKSREDEHNSPRRGQGDHHRHQSSHASHPLSRQVIGEQSHLSGVSAEEPVASSSRGRKVKEVRNVFTRMETMTGPLSFLNRCVKDKEHVRVMTRGAVTVNSICRGYIVAFDKFFNMAMIDVDEIYRRPAALGKVRARASHKLEAAQETLGKENLECRARWGALDKENPPSHGQRSYSLTSSTAVNKDNQQSSKTYKGSARERRDPLKPNLKRLQSVYPELKVPMSPFEREALMLGIPDENIETRHVNKMLLRGENVVSISIIEDL